MLRCCPLSFIDRIPCFSVAPQVGDTNSHALVLSCRYGLPCFSVASRVGDTTCTLWGVFVAPACGDTATETLRPRILPKATTLDLHRAQCPRFALTQASGLADTALERGHTICRPSRWTTKRYEGCATSSARRFRRPWERPHNSSQVQRLESETHPHLQREQQRCKQITKPHPIPGGSRIQGQGQITVPSPPVNHWCRE